MKKLVLDVEALADIDLSDIDDLDEETLEGADLDEVYEMVQEEVSEIDCGVGYDIECEASSFDVEDKTLTVCVSMNAMVTLPDDFTGTPEDAFDLMQEEITELDFGETYDIDSSPKRILESERTKSTSYAR